MQSLLPYGYLFQAYCLVPRGLVIELLDGDMRHLQLKTGLRGLVVAESFSPDSENSTLAGVVMRRDLVIDGLVTGTTTITGNDATSEILRMYSDLGRSDINYLLISGVIISMYNIVDIEKIHDALDIPVLGITHSKSRGNVQSALRRFPEFAQKSKMYKQLQDRTKISLHTSHDVFVRFKGCSTMDATRLLDGLVLQGAVPEPVRIAKMIAKSIREYHESSL